MTLEADIADDYLLFDGTETVTLMPYSGATAIPGVIALRGNLDRADLPVDGAYIGADGLSWSLWVATISGAAEPRQGGTITDADNVVHRIESAQLETLDTRWSVVTVKNRRNTP